MKTKIQHMFLMAVLLIAGVATATAAETANQVMNRASAAFRNARTLTAKFAMSGASGNMSGTFYKSGSKFAVVSGGASTWYNGKLMYSYNPQTGETTLVTPSASEVAESNPFSIIASMSSQFTAAYAKQQPAGSTVLVLLPKSARSNIKKVVLTLDKRRCVPTKVVMTHSGGTTTVAISNYSVGVRVAASVFEYPRSKYPKAKIIDLR